MAYYKASYVTDYREYFSIGTKYDQEAMEVYVYTKKPNDFEGYKSTIFYNPTYSLLGTGTVSETDLRHFTDDTYKVYKDHRSVSTISGEYTFDPYIATSYSTEYKELISSVSEYASLASTSRTAYSLSSVSGAITSRYYSSSRSTYSYNQYSTYTATSLGLSFTKSTTLRETTASVEAVETVIFSDWHSDNFYIDNYKSNTDGVTVTRTNDVLVTFYNIRETTDEQGSITTTFSAGYYDHNTLSITTIQSTSYYSVYTNVSTHGVNIYKTGDDYSIKYNVDSTFKASYNIPQDSYTTSVLGYEFIGNIRNTGSTVGYQSHKTETVPLELYGTGISSIVYYYRDAYDYMYLGVTSSAGYSASSPSVSYTFTSSGSSTYDTTVADLASISSSTTNRVGNSVSVTTYLTSFYTHSIPEYSVSDSFTKSTYSTTVVELSNLDISSTYTSLDLYENVTDSGYTYLTSFYGTIEADLDGNVVKTSSSWINSAIQYTRSQNSTEYNNNTLSLYTTTFKTFGNMWNSTTISYVSSYEKVYKTTVYSSSSVSTQSVSSTRSSANIPEEFFTTYNSTFRNETQFRTYMGPGISGYDNDEYNFNASVTSIYSYTDYISPITSSTSSSRLNTIDYGGTTYRLSDLISSKSWINVGNTNFTENYLYDYSVSSMYSFDDTYIKSLSTYTTILATSYTRALNTILNYNSYSVIKSTSLVGISTGDRFIDRVEISRTYTSSYDVSNTVVYYNGSTLDTISSSTSLYDTASEQDVSTVSRTFISSPSDLTTSSAVISSDTETAGRGSFVYSSRELVASTSEQQNDTLVFASTFNTISFYNSSYTTSTLNTVENTLSATTYEDWYNPVSWTETVLDIATSTGATETVVTNSGVVSITQSISFTPTYSDVNGIYVTQ